MSPYVGSPLSLGGAECSERDESGIFSTFGTDVGVWKAHTTSQGGDGGFTWPSGTVQRPLESLLRGVGRGLSNPPCSFSSSILLSI